MILRMMEAASGEDIKTIPLNFMRNEIKFLVIFI